MKTPARSLLTAAALLAAGCAARPKPPVVNLWERATLAVPAFAGDPADPALAADLRQDLVAALRALDAATIADGAAAPAGAAANSVSPWTDAAWRAVAGAGADLILTGAVREFRERGETDKPRRIRSQVDSSWKWGVSDTASAHLAATLVLVEAATGKVIWTKAAPGDGRDARWTDLSWPGENAAPPAAGWDALLLRARPAPPATGLRYPADTSAARARRAAIGEIVAAALADFTGRDGWEPPAKKL